MTSWIGRLQDRTPKARQLFSGNYMEITMMVDMNMSMLKFHHGSTAFFRGILWLKIRFVASRGHEVSMIPLLDQWVDSLWGFHPHATMSLGLQGLHPRHLTYRYPKKVAINNPPFPRPIILGTLQPLVNSGGVSLEDFFRGCHLMTC